jgi:hypothetical protein
MQWERMGEWRNGSTFLNLDTRCRWVMSSTPRPLNLKGNITCYHLVNLLGGPKVRCRLCGVGNVSSPFPGIEPNLPVYSYTDWATPCPLCAPYTFVITIGQENWIGAGRPTLRGKLGSERRESSRPYLNTTESTFPAVRYVGALWTRRQSLSMRVDANYAISLRNIKQVSVLSYSVTYMFRSLYTCTYDTYMI